MRRSSLRCVPDAVVVAIPVRDEAERIGACLAALVQAQTVPDHIVLLVNNTTDDTVEQARRVRLPTATRLHVMERTLPPHCANAGHARRLAMQEAARLAGPRGVLLTTDADGRVDADWLAANLQALAAGAGAVAGWVDLDPAEWSDIPMALHEADARECAYDSLCDEIHARLDPDPADPMPRHTQNSGASIAVTAAAFHTVDGIPDVPCGEDRAFFTALRQHDVAVRHMLACHVSVSGRIFGRASGGMADTIRRRLVTPDPWLDDRLEPAADCARRASLRRRARHCFEGGETPALALALGLDPARLAAALAQPRFGAAWAAIEATSPLLRRQRVAVADLPEQMAQAERICIQLRQRAAVPAATIEAGLQRTA